MITINKRGRLGNGIFQNCVASILSKKFDMKAEYLHEKELSLLNPKFHTGKRIYEEQVEVTNANLFEILEKKEIHHGLLLTGLFQLKPFILNYKKEILDCFDLQNNGEHSEDLFVHVRLGDTINKNPGLDYYIKAIEQINYQRGYISSDSFSHEIVASLIDRFNLIPYDKSRINTINFGKNFKNIVLSSGTFSWWIGFLSQAHNVFYPTGGPIWCGDIFVFDEWSPINIKLN
jgi:hypothetical protein